MSVPWAATSWFRVTVEIRRPCASAVLRNTADISARTASDPRNGTPNRNKAVAVASVMVSMPRTK